MSITIALIGNPNSGKTTLFNMLTGTYQKVGNWTGVTTEQKEGKFRFDKKITIVDLPGLYSLNADSPDEQVVKNYLRKNTVDFIINVIDVNFLERSLSLTQSLSKLNLPVTTVLTHRSQFEKSGKELNISNFEREFDISASFMPTSRRVEIEKFIEKVIKNSKIVHESPFTLKNKQESIKNKLERIISQKRPYKQGFWDKVDKISTNKYFALPIFFAVMTVVYFLSVKLGGFASSFIADRFNLLGENLGGFLSARGSPEWIISMIEEAIIGGFGTVLSFLPQILVLFALMGVIEQSGYATRIAFILDRLFRGVGLNGKSAMPLVACCGCTTTGLMCTRAIESVNERRATLVLAPFMPCGAKTAVFGWISYVFFGGNPFVSASMYFMALISVGFFGLILKKLKPFRTNKGYFALEMPLLKAPRIKDILLSLKEKVKDFLGKAALIVFLVSLLLWALKNLGVNGYTGGEVNDSFLYIIGNGIKWIFYPLGFGSWECSVAVLSGLFAKEAIVETLKIVSQNPNALLDSAYAVYSFMAFILLSPPCMASIVTSFREFGNKKWLIFALMFQFGSAYIVSLTINLWGILSQINSCLPFLIITGIIILIITIKKMKTRVKYGKQI